jgi:hypothetical protein
VEYVEKGLQDYEAKVLETEVRLLRKLARKQGFALVPPLQNSGGFMGKTGVRGVTAPPAFSGTRTSNIELPTLNLRDAPRLSHLSRLLTPVLSSIAEERERGLVAA